MEKLITLTMVKYQEIGLIDINEQGGFTVHDMVNRPIYIEYIEGDITFESFLNKYHSQIRGNCLSEYIMVDMYVMDISKKQYLKAKQGELREIKLIKELFRNEFFREETRVRHKGFYTVELPLQSVYKS